MLTYIYAYTSKVFEEPPIRPEIFRYISLEIQAWMQPLVHSGSLCFLVLLAVVCCVVIGVGWDTR